nr:hypothetical protein [Clostridia bacterium]
MSELIYDLPRSSGVANVIKRSRQLSQLKWKPVHELSDFNPITHKKFYYTPKSGLPYEGEELVGMPYSSTRMSNRLVGVHTSVDSFLTALANPASVIYTLNMGDFEEDDFHPTIKNTFLAFGTVCSAFVNYSLDLPTHQSTHQWQIAPDFFILPDDKQNADGIELGDTMVCVQPDGSTYNHVKMITAIGRDENGIVREIEISEGVVPRAVARRFSREDFNKMFVTEKYPYRVYRYRCIDSVKYEPLRCELGNIINDTLKLSSGEFFNYRFGDEIGFNICCDADELVIEGTANSYRFDVSALEPTVINGNSYNIFKIDSLVPDDYTAYCVKNGEAKPCVNFAVVKIPETKLISADGEAIKRIALTPVDPDGNELTRESRCFFNENGEPVERTSIGLKYDGRIVPARVAVKEIDGKLHIRTAAAFTDEKGNAVRSFVLGEAALLYAYAAKEGSVIRAEYSGAENVSPSYLGWMEEGAIGYYKRMLKPEELEGGYVETVMKRHNNDYAHLIITSVNCYGRVTSAPQAIVIE